MEKIHDAFSPDVSFTIEEGGKSEVDGKHVLAKVKGDFFFPGGVSRNNRFYSPQLWEKVLSNEEIQDKLKTRRMFGTISHDQKIDDVAILEGKISHVVTDLKIENGKGIGEALILDTPAGRIANTLFRAGSKMFVSSRADGDFSGTHNGVPKVDEDSYRLHSFDFVLDPGFLNASPTLKESLNEDFKEVFGTGLNGILEKIQPSGSCPDIKNDDSTKSTKEENSTEGEFEMSKELLESMVADKVKIEEQLTQALGQNEVLKGKIAVFEEQSKSKDVEIEALKSKVGEETDAKEKLGALLKDLDDLGDTDQIRETYEMIQDHLAKVKEAAKTNSMDEIYELLDFAVTVREKFGDLEEMETAYSMMREAIERWKELGPPDAVKEALEYANHHAKMRMQELVDSKAAKLAKELGYPVEIIAPMVAAGQSDDEIRGHFKKITESRKTQSRYRTDPAGNKKIEESNNVFDETPGMRLLEGMGGRRRDHQQ